MDGTFTTSSYTELHLIAEGLKLVADKESINVNTLASLRARIAESMNEIESNWKEKSRWNCRRGDSDE